MSGSIDKRKIFTVFCESLNEFQIREVVKSKGKIQFFLCSHTDKNGQKTLFFIAYDTDCRRKELSVTKSGNRTTMLLFFLNAVGISDEPSEKLKSALPTSSEEDVAETKRLRETGELVGIPLDDHVVIGCNGAHVSIMQFMRENLI